MALSLNGFRKTHSMLYINFAWHSHISLIAAIAVSKFVPLRIVILSHLDPAMLLVPLPITAAASMREALPTPYGQTRYMVKTQNADDLVSFRARLPASTGTLVSYHQYPGVCTSESQCSPKRLGVRPTKAI